jgi:hypothetical protein
MEASRPQNSTHLIIFKQFLQTVVLSYNVKEIKKHSCTDQNNAYFFKYFIILVP